VPVVFVAHVSRECLGVIRFQVTEAAAVRSLALRCDSERTVGLHEDRNLVLGAAYTPSTIAPNGLIYTENRRELLVVGARQAARRAQPRADDSGPQQSRAGPKREVARIAAIA
jgi:hypothetical protein